MAKSAKKATSTTKRRAARPYPTAPFEDVLVLARTLFDTGSGSPVRRLTVFDEIGKSPDSSASRELVTNSSKYGLTKGSYKAEQLELTDKGRKAVDPDVSPRERARSKIEAAINNIELFNSLFEISKDKKLPARNFLIDACRENGIPDEHVEEAVDTFLLNLRYVGLLKTLSGAERVISTDMALDELPSGKPNGLGQALPLKDSGDETHDRKKAAVSTEEMETTCFIVTPIGEEDSEERTHADLMLGSYIEPVVDEFGLTVVRADKIQKSGMITRQIIDYLINAKLVIADLSFSNPNVFYELAIRHASRMPVVQLIRKGDRIPFDVNQVRTIPIDLTSVYAAIPQIDISRTELRNQIRKVLENPAEVDTPISIFYPEFNITALQG